MKQSGKQMENWSYDKCFKVKVFSPMKTYTREYLTSSGNLRFPDEVKVELMPEGQLGDN